MAESLVCAVSGANGYVGSAVADALQRGGMRVVGLCRHERRGLENRSFRLGDPVHPRLLDGIDALVHCAWDFRASTWPSNRTINVAGSLRLLESGAKAGLRSMVFISSMSAFEGCKSMYGRAKLEVETAAAAWRVHVVRPGLVYGPACRGMVGALARLAVWPVLPLVGTGKQQLYLAHEEDLGELVRRICCGDMATRRQAVIAAHPRPYTLREIIRLLAAAQGKRPCLLPFPLQLEWLALKMVELIGIRSRLRSDSLIGLINQAPSPSFDRTDCTSEAFRDFAAEIQTGLKVI
jgi:nucleoside-diphosphate-sugar epimerase